MYGGDSTLILAEAVPPVPPSVEVKLPVVLFCTPGAVPVTATEKVQLLFGEIPSDAPDKLIELVPCVAVIVPPPQDPLRPFGVEMISPDGKVSLKPTPFSVVAGLLFVSVKLSE